MATTSPITVASPRLSPWQSTAKANKSWMKPDILSIESFKCYLFNECSSCKSKQNDQLSSTYPSFSVCFDSHVRTSDRSSFIWKMLFKKMFDRMSRNQWSSVAMHELWRIETPLRNGTMQQEWLQLQERVSTSESSFECDPSGHGQV